MKAREAKQPNYPILVASSIALAAGLLLLPLSERPREEDRVARQELTAQSYIALHDGWLYFKSDRNLTFAQDTRRSDSLYVYRVPLEGGTPVLFAQLPPTPVRSPSEYCLPSNDFITGEIGLHYVEYKLPSKPATSKAVPARELSASPSGYARVYTYPWSPLAPTVTPVPTSGRIVEVLRITPRQVMYYERAPVATNSGESPTILGRVPMKRVPLRGRAASLMASATNAEDGFNDVLLGPVTAKKVARTLLSANRLGGTICPEQTASGFWWIRSSDGKLCRITARDNRVQVVEPPLRYDTADTLKCLWLRRAGNRVYLRCDIERTDKDKKLVHPYLQRLPERDAMMPSSWGAPVLLSEAMRNADKVFLEQGRAYFLCSEDSQNAAHLLQSLLDTEHREPLVSALYRVPLPN